MESVNLTLRDGLPFVPLRLEHGDRAVELSSVLIDTGSSASIFSVETLAELQLTLSPNDPLIPMRGVGGVEYVVQKAIDRLHVGEAILDRCTVQVGGLDYGYGIEGILGMDVLVRLRCIIDLRSLTLSAGHDG